MLEEEQTAVTPEEQSATSNEETQTQEAQGDQQQTQETQTQEQTQGEGQTQQQIDDRGVDYKNVAAEYRRKLDEMPSVIQRTVQEALAQGQQNQQPKQQEYTVAQLEQFAQDNPQHRAWVEEEKFKLLQKNIEKTTEERFKAADRQRSDTQVRQQTEQWVVNHPKFKECFVTDPSGTKVWNMNNPLTQTMSTILNQIDPVSGKMVKDRPDGLAIAAEMAYGRFALANEGKTQTSVQKLKKDLRNVQKQTMTVGQGVQTSSKSTSEYQAHINNYQKSYSPKDAQAATKAYLKSIGIIKE